MACAVRHGQVQPLGFGTQPLAYGQPTAWQMPQMPQMSAASRGSQQGKCESTRLQWTSGRRMTMTSDDGPHPTRPFRSVCSTFFGAQVAVEDALALLRGYLGLHTLQIQEALSCVH